MASAIAPLEAFLLVVGIFAVSLIGGIVQQKRHERELSKRLGKVFDDKQQE